VNNRFNERISGIRQKKSINRSYIKSNISLMSNIAFGLDNVDLFFAAYDSDNEKEQSFNNELSLIKSHLKNNAEHCIILIPVQCIEHWLWYIKHCNENTLKYTSTCFEKEDKIKAKIEAYGRKKPIKEHIEAKIDEYLTNIDLNCLIKYSFSFRRFANDFKLNIIKYCYS
jgi:hypothetical protein